MCDFVDHKSTHPVYGQALILVPGLYLFAILHPEDLWRVKIAFYICGKLQNLKDNGVFPLLTPRTCTFGSDTSVCSFADVCAMKPRTSVSVDVLLKEAGGAKKVHL